MFNFSRRINRATFIAGLLLLALGIVFIDFIQSLFEVTNVANEDFVNDNNVASLFLGVFTLAGVLILFVYAIALTRQRANDIGWHPLLITFITFWNPLIIILAVFPGLKTQNKFGHVPKTGLHLKN